MVSRPQPYMDDPLAPLLRMVLSSRGTLLIDRNENSAINQENSHLFL